jgi:hypothetical protein
MKIGAMNHPARNPLEEIDWFGRQGFAFVDFTLEPPADDAGQIEPSARLGGPSPAVGTDAPRMTSRRRG